MGQARNLGTRERRIAEAQNVQKGTFKLHAFINETRTEEVLLTEFPCAECGLMIIPDPSSSQVLDVPVRHGTQYGACQNCNAQHFVVSASNKQDCITLQPIFESVRRSMSVA